MKERITAELVRELAKTDYFDHPDSPACIAILPFVKSEHMGVEIGVFKGISSIVFLEHCRFMYFIDPCMSYEDSSDPTVFAQPEGFLMAVIPYGTDRFNFLQTLSAEAAPMVPEVDFVFIDGNHKRKYVEQDMALYWPKVKSGGFLSGHDYNQDGVRQAVDEFAAKVNLPVERHQYCWLIKKP